MPAVSPVPARVVLRGALHLPAAPEAAFAWFTPEGERAYVDGWDPVWHFAGDGPARAEGVFTTAHDGAETLWLVLAIDAARREARYVRVTPGERIGIVEVRCVAEPAGGTRVEVAYRMTALGDAGAARLAAFADGGFEAMLAEWARRIPALASPGAR